MRFKHALSTGVLTLALVSSWVGVAHATGDPGAGAAVQPYTATHPATTLRAVVKSNGAIWVGSPGFTVAHTGSGTYHISFPAGTWGSPSCWFVPTFQPVFSSGTISVTGLAEYGDGSGQMDIKVSSGDSWFAMTATSASC
jgi:hypothetical protein